ncbi:MAG: hypothetical protein Q9165_007907 [Trypethelium subeluteriae]
MKNALVYYDPELTVTIEDIPIPAYGPDEILIKVVTAGSNPKDYKHPHPKRFNVKVKVNQGDDVAGIVQAVGAHIRTFHSGDRVAAFHQMDTPRHLRRVQHHISFEEATTIPLAAYTAAVGVYLNLGLPLPWERRRGAQAPRSGGTKTPLVVNGAASAVGAFAVKFARMHPDVGPVVGTARPGWSAEYARRIGCDVVVDYRGSVEEVTEELKKALCGAELHHVFDASNSLKSVRYASACFAPTVSGERSVNRYTGTLPFTMNPMWKDVYPDTAKIEETLQQVGCWYGQIWVGCVHEDKIESAKMFGSIASKIMEMGLAEGTFSGQPYELIPNGLEGVYGGLVKLRDRKGGNTKLVYRIADTPGL